MATMNEIDAGAARYATMRGQLAGHVRELADGIERLKREHLGAIKRAVARAKAAGADLSALIEASPELFAKPRTQILHGIKVGFRKGSGKLEFDDADQVVKLIRKHYPEQFDVLVKTTEKPIKSALEQLTAAELKKLGIVVEDTGDVVLIKDTTSDIDKLVTALLKEEEPEG